MKRVAGILIASLMLMPLTPVYASETTSDSTSSDTTTAGETVVLQDIYKLNYSDIEKVIMQRNPQVKVNLDSIDNADNGYLAVDDSRGDISSSVEGIAKKIKQLRAQESADGVTEEEKAAIDVQIRGYQAQIASLGNNIESLENQAEDMAQTKEIVKLNAEMTNQQILQKTETAFFNNDALANKLQQLENNISYLTKKNATITLQKSLGMVSDLDVSNFDQQIKDLNYQLGTLKQQQDLNRGQVNLMIGQDFNHPLELDTNVSFDESQIGTLDYNKDLTTTTEKSYALQIQQMQIDAKQLSLQHAEETDGLDSYSYKAAQADLDSQNTKLADLNKSIKQAFDKAYNDVQEKLDALKLEQSRLENLKTQLNNAQLSNKVGLMSDLDLTNTQVTYDAQVLTAQSAQEDLMQAYTTYQWLLKGVTSN